MRRALALVVLTVALALAAALWFDASGEAVGPAARPLDVAGAGPGPSEPDAEAAPPREAVAIEVSKSAPPSAAAAPPEVESQGPCAIELRVLRPDGSPWEEGEVRIHAEQSPIEAQHQIGFVRSKWTRPTFAVLEQTDVRGTWSSYLTDERGRVRIVGVVPGRHFSLRAMDELGDVGATSDEPPMAPGEIRERELRLERRPFPLSGRCVSSTGDPLPDLAVHVRSRQGYVSLATDAFGAFESSPLFGHALALTVQDEVHGTCLLDGLDPLHGPVEARLEPGRTLRVTLRDERGEPVTVSYLRARVTREGPLAAVHPEVLGSAHVFRGLPRRPLTLTIDMPWPPLAREIDESIEALEWSVPGRGELYLVVEKLPEDIDGDWLLELSAPQWPERPAKWWPLLNSGYQQLRWNLWSGRHRLQLHFRARDDGDPRPWGAPLELEILDGETSSATMGG